MALVNFNGRLIASAECSLQLNNRSFRYGDGFFESIRIYNGSSPLFHLHQQRLQESLHTLNIELDSSDFHEKLKELATLNGHQNGRGRITVFRDSSGLYHPDNNTGAYLIETSAMEEALFPLNEKGFRFDFYRRQVKASGALAGIKSTSALLYVMASQFSAKNGLDDCIILNEKGNIAETSRANIFFVKSGIVYTPALSEGCIPGVMRQHIINCIEASGSRVVQEAIHPDFLAGCQEMFSSSATQGIRWAESCGPFCFTKSLSIVLQRKITENIS